MTPEEISASGSVLDLITRVWEPQGEWRMYRRAHQRAVDQGDAVRAATLEKVLAGYGEVPALDALRANQRIVELLTGWRWIVMRDAREEGASWSEIGDALGMSKQGAWDYYKNAITRQARYVPDFHDDDAARAVLGDVEH